MKPFYSISVIIICILLCNCNKNNNKNIANSNVTESIANANIVEIKTKFKKQWYVNQITSIKATVDKDKATLNIIFIARAVNWNNRFTIHLLDKNETPLGPPITYYSIKKTPDPSRLRDTKAILAAIITTELKYKINLRDLDYISTIYINDWFTH